MDACGGWEGVGSRFDGDDMTELLEIGDASLSYAVRGRGRGLLVPRSSLGGRAAVTPRDQTRSRSDYSDLAEPAGVRCNSNQRWNSSTR